MPTTTEHILINDEHTNMVLQFRAILKFNYTQIVNYILRLKSEKPQTAFSTFSFLFECSLCFQRKNWQFLIKSVFFVAGKCNGKILILIRYAYENIFTSNFHFASSLEIIYLFHGLYDVSLI